MADSAEQQKPNAVDELVTRFYGNPIVQQAFAGYSFTKENVPLAGRALGVAEAVAERARPLADAARPYVDPYLERPAAKINSVYDFGAEKTTQAVARTRQAAITTGTLGIGTVVVASQLGLALSLAGTNLVLDSLIYSKKLGTSAVEGVVSAEKAVEERIHQGIARAQGVAKIPIDKVSESTNALLDVANALADRLFGAATESEATESGIRDRVSFLARRIVSGLNSRAHQEVIDPLTEQLRSLVDRLSKNLVLVEAVRERTSWAGARVGELSASVGELKQRIEDEARSMAGQPEELLMSSVRTTSRQVVDNLEALKKKKTQLTNNGAVVESWINYVQSFDARLGEAGNLYTVSEEVLSEARQRVGELAQWAASLLVRSNSTASDSIGTANGPSSNTANGPTANSVIANGHKGRQEEEDEYSE